MARIAELVSLCTKLKNEGKMKQSEVNFFSNIAEGSMLPEQVDELMNDIAKGEEAKAREND